MGNAERTEPLTMIGPRGLEKVVKALRMIAQELPFEINFIELSGDRQIIDIGEYKINAFKVKHNVTCFGYSIEIDRKGRFNPEKAKELNLPVKCWGLLQKGKTIIYEDKKYTPDMVMGERRKGS